MQCNRKKLAETLGHDVKAIDKMVARVLPYVSLPSLFAQVDRMTKIFVHLPAQ